MEWIFIVSSSSFIYLMLFSKDKICKFVHFSFGELGRADVLNNMESPMTTIFCLDS